MNNLKVLALASAMYFADHEDYWYHEVQCGFPHDMQVPTVNAHIPYMAGSTVSRPCPKTDIPDAFWSETSPATPKNGTINAGEYFYCGYGYYGNLRNATRPERVAKKDCESTAVLWADTVSYFDTWLPPIWYYPHPRTAGYGPFWAEPMSRVAGIRVQHLAHVDGSVESRHGVSEIFQGDDPLVKSWSEHSSQEGSWYFWWF